MSKYDVHYTFQKGNAKAVGSGRVDAETDFMATQIAEGKARHKYNRDGYAFAVTSIERR
jgi:hypothetical protein